MRQTAFETTCPTSDWIQSTEGKRVCRRVSRIFPLSPDASVRRAAIRARLCHEGGASEDVLVLDAVHQLSGTEAAA